VVDAYGADALRFTLAANASQGRDLKIGPKTAETNRNFATKLWNAARFAEMMEANRLAGFDPKAAKHPLNRWIAGEAAKAARETTAAIEAYRFNDAAGAVYRFIWNVICDWYLELAKPILNGEDAAVKEETRAMLAWTLDQATALLHPFMPFITEELHAQRGGEGLVALAAWPKLEGLGDAEAESEIGWLIEMISEIRSARSEMNVPPGSEIPLVLIEASARTRELADAHGATLNRMAKIGVISSASALPAQASQIVVRGEAAALPLAGVIDFAAERARLSKEAERLKGEIDKTDQKLANPDFVARAPDEVIEEQKTRRAEAAARLQKIGVALQALG
jgi:valyl-tRNA synthetase